MLHGLKQQVTSLRAALQLCRGTLNRDTSYLPLIESLPGILRCQVVRLRQHTDSIPRHVTPETLERTLSFVVCR